MVRPGGGGDHAAEAKCVGDPCRTVRGHRLTRPAAVAPGDPSGGTRRCQPGGSNPPAPAAAAS
eukprot:15453253-Alexandrium_andersonii.AAC.1